MAKALQGSLDETKAFVIEELEKLVDDLRNPNTSVTYINRSSGLYKFYYLDSEAFEYMYSGKYKLELNLDLGHEQIPPNAIFVEEIMP